MRWKMNNKEKKIVLLNQLATYSNMIDEATREINELTTLVERLEKRFDELDDMLKQVNQDIVKEKVEEKLVSSSLREE